jgi:hypothetical protein
VSAANGAAAVALCCVAVSECMCWSMTGAVIVWLSYVQERSDGYVFVSAGIHRCLASSEAQLPTAEANTACNLACLWRCTNALPVDALWICAAAGFRVLSELSKAGVHILLHNERAVSIARTFGCLA